MGAAHHLGAGFSFAEIAKEYKDVARRNPFRPTAATRDEMAGRPRRG